MKTKKVVIYGLINSKGDYTASGYTDCDEDGGKGFDWVFLYDGLEESDAAERRFCIVAEVPIPDPKPVEVEGTAELLPEQA
jgi:hypothetical protein